MGPDAIHPASGLLTQSLQQGTAQHPSLGSYQRAPLRLSVPSLHPRQSPAFKCARSMQACSVVGTGSSNRSRQAGGTPSVTSSTSTSSPASPPSGSARALFGTSHRARSSARASASAGASAGGGASSSSNPSPARQGAETGRVYPRASLTGVPESAEKEEERVGEDSAKGKGEGKEAHRYRRQWHFATQVQSQGALRARSIVPASARSVAITVHGCIGDDDAVWLQQQVSALEGVHEVHVQGRKEGGLRGGAVQLQVEAEPWVRLPQLVDAVHAIEERLLALPFKTHSWIWKGHKISYAVAGCGKPVILVHGFGGSAGHFRNLVAQLADDHRVYAVDLLGFGNSDKPADVAYGPELWADIINDFALEFADEPPVLIGNSIGSLTALTAAAQAPSLRGLVLLNVAGAMNRKGLMQDDLMLRALSPIFIAIEYLLQRPKVASFLFERFRSKANVRKILFDQVYRDKGAVDDRLLDILYEPSQDDGALDVFVRVFTGEPGPRPEELLPQIDVPMLVLWGDADPWTPINGKVAQLFRELQQERDNVNLVSLPDVGHCPHDDRPELAASHILPWLSSLDSADL